MTLVENITKAVTRYADGETATALANNEPIADRERIVAAYLSGAMQLAAALCKMDGGAPHPTRFVAAIEEVGKNLLGHGSVPPKHG